MQIDSIEKDKKKIELVYEYIQREFKINKNQIHSKVRTRDINDARRLFWYVMRNYFEYSFQKIGDITLHNHATIISACKKFDEYSSIYPKITTIPYKDICFQLDLVKDSLEEQVIELKQKMVVINQELDRILTIKQLENGRQKLHC